MVSALIPAFNPSGNLIELLRGLVAAEFSHIIVVNDGSGTSCDPLFKEAETFPGVTVLRHAVNLGKGAALKTGLNFACCNFPGNVGVVTIDADGQHLASDALKVAKALDENPDALILGVRTFGGKVPLRSLVGNLLTKKLFRVLVGQKLTDTQTGLRGIPTAFIPKLLQIDSRGYEYELDMLLACKYGNRHIVEREISTVYVDENASSHFNPFFDSMKIYFVLFRFSFASLATAAIDYAVFFLSFRLNQNILASQALARLVAMVFNYLTVKRLVFYSDQKHTRTFPKYAALVVLSGSVSFLLIDLMVHYASINVLGAKVVAELLIFLANFAIQRDFIFTEHAPRDLKTDWDAYYSRPFAAAAFTRRITERNLLECIQLFAPNGGRGSVVGELGGANSCFYEGILQALHPSEYHVFDNNLSGLRKLETRVREGYGTQLHYCDLLEYPGDGKLDLAFSVGLVEHFAPEDTKRMILAHLKLLRRGGVAVISFPTPTWLYRTSRRICEWSGRWIFHDERPLTKGEVVEALGQQGRVIHERLIWRILLTQRMMVIRRDESMEAEQNGAPPSSSQGNPGKPGRC